jgi:CIC family chloride channel protein
MTALPAFAVLGVVAALLGIFFNRSLLFVLARMGKLSGRNVLLVTAAVGAATGLIGWFAPGMIGGGHGLTEIALVGRVAFGAIPLIFALRFVQTIFSYGTGAPGGIFAPLLVLGALLGLTVGNGVHAVAPWAAPDPAVFAVIGMAAYFTAIVRAPLTGIVLIVEMTGNYNQMLPLLVACFCAYAVAESLHDIPIYEALLQRDLRRGGVDHELHQPMVLELVIEPEAPFAGKQIRQLGLPPGCIIVRCRQSGREWVPNAGTRLEPHMRITAMIAPEAAQGLIALRHGCGLESL